MVLVAPGPCEPSRCEVRGDVWEGIAGRQAGVDISLFDGFGNLRPLSRIR